MGLDIVISATFNTNFWRPSITTTNSSTTHTGLPDEDTARFCDREYSTPLVDILTPSADVVLEHKKGNSRLLRKPADAAYRANKTSRLGYSNRSLNPYKMRAGTVTQIATVQGGERTYELDEPQDARQQQRQRNTHRPSKTLIKSAIHLLHNMPGRRSTCEHLVRSTTPHRS
jgi:hypothetical protein